MIMKSLRKECGEQLSKKALRDRRILVLEGDLCESTQSVIFKHKFPDRHLEMGIAEQNMVGVAAGLASCGKIPFVHSFACFLSMRTCEQIRTTVCYPRLNVKFIATHAGLFAGSAGTTHHAIEDLAIMRAMPNMTVLSPGDPLEMRQVIDAALRYNGPVYIRIAKDDIQDVFDKKHKFQIGKSVIIGKGRDAAIITTGTMLSIGLSAMRILKKEYKINAVIIHCASIKPIDRECIIKMALKMKNILTLEEHSIIGGLGDAVSEIIAGVGIGRVVKIGIKDHFCGGGSAICLMQQEELTVESIINTVRRLIENTRQKYENY